MNGLSWIFYLADVSQSVDTVTWIITVISALLLLITGVFVAFSFGSDFTVEQGETFRAGAKRATLFLTPIIIGAFLLSSILPERQTLMLIAASELGETVLTSDGAQAVGGEVGELAVDSLKMLRKYVNEQLGEAKEPKKSPTTE